MDPQAPCPCGTGRTYGECCAPAHSGTPAPSPEALMRSRYSAFVLGLTDYLRQSWHPSTRPASLDRGDTPQWTGLTVLSSTSDGDRGQVHFRAIYRESGQWGYLEEKSDFVVEDGRWYYLSGNPQQGVLKPGRNDRCPCGSGRKFKSCCLS
ncbi:YchJ family protein [Marinobacter bohaiensis]|uniref:YchJ family protein n=1 Tax=Marinobacter bohaiensis TaxID=2201898 RepID=UPI000DAC36DB|nr:YchJ family protein [Marinobacter bohaiensis]